MIGRKKEIEHLNALYGRDCFEFLVMYGRRRVGKTTVLKEFSKNADAIFYPAQEKNDALNLEDFSKMVQLHFDGMMISPFESWKAAFEYIGKKADKRTAIIIDEFPFIAEENPTIKSILQHEIDHSWKDNKNLFLILCGSSASFMETEVMGAKSPLHGRQTSSLEIKPFDYLDSSLFCPRYSDEEKLIVYGMLGGIPRYLEVIDDEVSLEKNIVEKIIKTGAYLHEEPENLLRAELRETNTYNSILSAISNGRNTLSLISDYIHEERSKVSKYIITLQTMRLIEKRVPCGESKESRKGIYVITDSFYKFWFRYKFTNNAYYEMLGENAAAAEIMGDMSNLMGDAFETICTEYMIRLAKKRKLSFVPERIGKWWGNNPAIKEQDDVDILLMNEKKSEAIFVECKFTAKKMPMSEYDDLVTATLAFSNIEKKHLMFISKSGYESSVIKRAKEEGATLLTIKDLFKE